MYNFQKEKMVVILVLPFFVISLYYDYFLLGTL